jgi:hypothetical protein
VQMPEVHCDAEMHRLPFATAPHVEPTHGWPTQSALVVHVVAHEVLFVWHLNGLQGTDLVALHALTPSHANPVTTTFVVLSQEPAPQLVPFDQIWHWPFPSHLPSVLQVEAALVTQATCGAGAT